MMLIDKSKFKLEYDYVYVYSEEDNTVDVIDSVTNQYVYSSKSKVIDGIEEVTTTEFNSEGEPVDKHVDRFSNGQRIDEDNAECIYDDQQRPIKIIHESGDYELLSYKGNNLIKKELYSKDKDDIFLYVVDEFDKEGRIIKKTIYSRQKDKHDKVYDTVNYSYNGLGLLVEVTRSHKQCIRELFYDKKNRLVIEREDSEAGHSEINYNYDCNGLLIEQIDSNGHVTVLVEYEYDDKKRIISETCYEQKL